MKLRWLIIERTVEWDDDQGIVHQDKVEDKPKLQYHDELRRGTWIDVPIEYYSK
jgi:hypothetical protein